MVREAARTDYSQQKRRAIQDAGARVFLRLGYEAASMDVIAGEAGVAKQTVYNHFHNKETLFGAIVDELREELLSALIPRNGADSDPEHVLETFGRQFLSLVLRPSSLALHRVLVAEAVRFPHLAREVYAAGPAQTVARLADYLRVETARGRLAVTEPALAAEQLLGTLIGHIQLRALFGVGAAAPAEVEHAVGHAVRSFLRAHAPRSRREPGSGG